MVFGKFEKIHTLQSQTNFDPRFYLDKDDAHIKPKLNSISGVRDYSSNNQYFKSFDEIFDEFDQLFAKI